MRTPSRRALALLVTALLLGGCSVGGSHPDSGRGAPSAHISQSGGASAGASGTPRRAAPVRPWNVKPPTVAALGDSITRGFDACQPLTDCPQVSWATGSRTKGESVSARLGASESWNLAQSGALIADLPAQARAAAAHRPAMVTVLIGANDACTADVGAMTPVADFRATFEDTLAYLHRTLPDTQVMVASIPDLERLWSVGRSSKLGSEVWKLGLCPTMLADANSDSASAQARRTEVRDRVIAYNAALGQVCQQYARCRYDGGAVFRYPFSTSDLSTWDWFHPNERGQGALAGVLAGVAERPSSS
jgi:lysophospholipase L1-like esterase